MFNRRGITYDQFCNYMNIISDYKTMVLSENAFYLSPEFRNSVVERTEDGSYVVYTGRTNKYQAEQATGIVNANMEHMDRYQRETSLAASNTQRRNGLTNY